jgi:hypothetical protein
MPTRQCKGCKSNFKTGRNWLNLSYCQACWAIILRESASADSEASLRPPANPALPYCPYCASSAVQGFQRGHGTSNGGLGDFSLRTLRALLGQSDANQVRLQCLDCGRIWVLGGNGNVGCVLPMVVLLILCGAIAIAIQSSIDVPLRSTSRQGGAANHAVVICGRPSSAKSLGLTWLGYRCRDQAQARDWKACLDWKAYADSKDEGCPGEQRCCPR